MTDPGSSGISADVVPAFTHRLYVTNSTTHIDGIAFLTQREHRRIVSFPKQHHERGVDKQKATNNEYKSNVRIFKNVKSHLADQGTLTETAAPSYFVESLVFNVDDEQFAARTWGDQFVQVYNFINGADLSKLCANGIIPLFGPSEEQWDFDSARSFLRRVEELWNNW